MAEQVERRRLPENARNHLEEYGDFALTDPDPELLDALEVKEHGVAKEKGTHLRLDSVDNKALISSSEAAAMRSLLDHGHALVQDVHLSKPGGDIYISAVSAELPLGTVTVKSKPRLSNALSRCFP